MDLGRGSRDTARRAITPPPRAGEERSGDVRTPPPRGNTATDLAFSIGLAVQNSPGRDEGRGHKVAASEGPRRMPQQPHSTGSHLAIGDYSMISPAGWRELQSSSRNAGTSQRLTQETISSLIEGPDSGARRSPRGSFGSRGSAVSYESSSGGDRPRSGHSQGGQSETQAALHDDDDIAQLQQSLSPELRQYGALVSGRSTAGMASSAGPAKLTAENLARRTMLESRGVGEGRVDGGAAGGSAVQGGDRQGRQALQERATPPPSASPRTSAWESEEGSAGGLSEAVIRRLKQKNAQLDMKLREKERHNEEIFRHVTSWKKSIRDQQGDKVMKLEQALKSQIREERERGLSHKVRAVRAVAKQYRMLTKMACVQHWFMRTTARRNRSRIADVEARHLQGERMIGFLKEQLSSTGRRTVGIDAESELVKVNSLLMALLTMIPSGIVCEFDEEAILEGAKGVQDEGGAAVKVGMVWSEVRELVKRTTGQHQPGGAGGGEKGGISNELAIARLRGKVDHLTQILKSRDSEVASLKEQVSGGGLEAVSKERAMANVRIKELEQLVSEAGAANLEKEAAAKSLTARVASLSATLQAKEEEGAVLTGLKKRIEELHEIASPLSARDDAFACLKRIGAAMEGLRVKCGDLQTQVLHSAQRLEKTQEELRDSLGTVAELSAVRSRADELEKELLDLKDGSKEVEGMLQKALKELDSAHIENVTLQTQAKQMLLDAERVSNLARERAHALEEKGKVIEGLQKANREAENAHLAVNDELAAARLEIARTREESGSLLREAEGAKSALLSAEEKLATADAELNTVKKEVERLGVQLKSSSAALRERDAVETRAKIDEQNVLRLQAEVKSAAAEVASVRERIDEKERRVEALERELADARSEAKRNLVHSQVTGTPSRPIQEGGGCKSWEGEMVSLLEESLTWAEEEAVILRAMVRSRPKGGAPECGCQGKKREGVFGDGGAQAGGGANLAEWKRLAAQGMDAHGFGQYGIKRPLFTAVRSTFFKA